LQLELEALGFVRVAGVKQRECRRLDAVGGELALELIAERRDVGAQQVGAKVADRSKVVELTAVGRHWRLVDALEVRVDAALAGQAQLPRAGRDAHARHGVQQHQLVVVVGQELIRVAAAGDAVGAECDARRRLVRAVAAELERVVAQLVAHRHALIEQALGGVERHTIEQRDAIAQAIQLCRQRRVGERQLTHQKACTTRAYKLCFLRSSSVIYNIHTHNCCFTVVEGVGRRQRRSGELRRRGAGAVVDAPAVDAIGEHAPRRLTGVAEALDEQLHTRVVAIVPEERAQHRIGGARHLKLGGAVGAAGGRVPADVVVEVDRLVKVVLTGHRIEGDRVEAQIAAVVTAQAQRPDALRHGHVGVGAQHEQLRVVADARKRTAVALAAQLSARAAECDARLRGEQRVDVDVVDARRRARQRRARRVVLHRVE
jgi:hypothetical protein